MASIVMKNFILFITFLFLLTFCQSQTFAQQPSVIEQMLRIRPSLVEVSAVNAAATLNTPAQRAYFKDPKTGKIAVLNRGTTLATYQRAGAGVIIQSSGIIVTNAHIVGNAQRVNVLLADGQKQEAQVVRFAPDLDIALLKINVPTTLRAVYLADSSQIMLNQEIFSVGSSPLLKEAISGGKITGLASSRNAAYSNAYESDFFQTSMNIYKGDSGGPLFNRRGELVGLMTAKMLSRDNASFAVSSNKIRRYLIAYLRETQPPQ